MITRAGVLGILVAVSLAVGGAIAQRTPPRVMSMADVLSGTEEQEIRWPVAVAADADRLAVADAFRPRLLIFRRVGVAWSLESTVELPEAPAGLAWSDGRWVLSLRGQEGLVAIEESGGAPTEIALPAGVLPGRLAARSGGGLLVHDQTASTVLRLDRDGTVSGSTRVEGTLTGLTDDGAGGFLAAFASESRIVRFDAAGQPATSWDLPAPDPTPVWPAGLVAEPGGRVFVADRHNGRIVVLDGAGRWVGLGSREGWDPGLLKHPAGIARLPEGDLIVADQGNGRVQIFRLVSEGPGS